ncbi:hypothetical protein IW261DRAFT_1557247 [Armillaria novae-zelandiae]|uniref:NADH dehydrogenase [ubiquinone] iron-sulfur protein 5 n=1 Tax=Armillaria novae-zelandiae TaxID=153914 RepID=A0AA39PR27_9AGAR|nr:hypothetical protein IW261DRAFT_1557247 [Armillaria novae-zelandiae]
MSGFSWTGSRPRCFVYWQEFSKCYSQADVPQQCTAQSADYLECLHGDKEAARTATIAAEATRQGATKVQEAAKEEGLPVGVGLIQRS